MKSALILGGTQFFGKRLVQLLLNKGVEVTIATRGKAKDPFGNNINRLVIDRNDRLSLENSVSGLEWDVVFDQTCMASKEALDAYEVLNGKIKKYIFTSSMAVYEYGVNHKEEDFNPYSCKYRVKTREQYNGMEGYSEAKRHAEAILFQKFAIPVVAARFPMVVGVDDYTNRFKFHVDHIVNRTPFIIPNRDISLNFISSEDAANLLYQAAVSDIEGPLNGASRGIYSLSKFIQLMEEVVDKEAIILSHGESEDVSPYALPGSLSVDPSKAEGLGIQFKPVEKLLKDLIVYYESIS